LEGLEGAVVEEIVGVAPEIVEKVLIKTASKLVREVEKVKMRIADIRRAIETKKDIFTIGKIEEEYEKLCYAAIDSSFTAPAIELVGGYLGIIAVVKEFYGSRCSKGRQGFIDAEAYVELWFNRDYVNEFAKYYERATAKKLLEMKMKGETYFDVLLLDGEIIPRIWRSSTANPVDMKIIEITNSVIDLADRTDTAIVGVLKRSYSRDIVNILGYHDLRLSDRAVLSLALEPGEYLAIAGYYQLHQELEALKNKRGVDKKWLKARLKWYEGLLQNIPVGYNIKLAFYRAMKTLYPTATKIEYTTSNSIHEDALLTNLIQISTSTGLPAPIDEVDRLATTTLSRELKHTVYQKLIAEVAKNTKIGIKEIQSLLSLMNPEKLSSILG
jgi:hypothetical protein